MSGESLNYGVLIWGNFVSYDTGESFTYSAKYDKQIIFYLTCARSLNLAKNQQIFK